MSLDNFLNIWAVLGVITVLLLFALGLVTVSRWKNGGAIYGTIEEYEYTPTEVHIKMRGKTYVFSYPNRFSFWEWPIYRRFLWLTVLPGMREFDPQEFSKGQHVELAWTSKGQFYLIPSEESVFFEGGKTTDPERKGN